MPWCVVIGCRNNLKATKSAGKDVSYHIFPKNPERRSAWINILNRPFKFNADSSYICSEHFIPDDFECNSLKEELLNIKIKKQLKKTAIPSINIPKSSGEKLPEVSIDPSNSQNPKSININLKNMSETDMHSRCAVPMCPNRTSGSSNSSNDILFHKFPNDVKVREKWLKFCNDTVNENKSLVDYQNATICSKHFLKDNYIKFDTDSMAPSTKELKKDVVPSINNPTKILKSNKEESIRLERKKLVDKLLADYEEREKNEGRLKSMVNKYPCFFSPKIDPNAKLGDKLKLLKAIDNPESYCPPKKRKMTTKSMLGTVEVLPYKQASSSKEQVIQISAVKGGLMLHALPQIGGNPSNNCSENNISDDENEIIIVTEDEATYDFNLTVDTEKHKENNTEVIIVSSSKETEDMETVMHVEIESMESLTKTPAKLIDSNKCMQDQFKNNKSSYTAVCSTQVTLSEEKGCQVVIPCKGCEQRSLKINKLLRERTRMMRDLNQNGIWKDPDEINTLKKLNGVLSLLLLQCIGEKYGKKSKAIRVDIVQDSIERINRGWSMQETSETLCQVLSANAYDELARSFSIINEV